MAKVLSSISLDSPTSPVSGSTGSTFTLAGTSSVSGGGGTQRYDLFLQVNDGGGWVTIATSGTGLTSADPTELINTNSQSTQLSATVSLTSVGSYTVRVAGASTSGGGLDVFSSTQTVEATQAPDALLADDVQSTSELTTPIANTEYGLLANDVQSTSELTTPTLVEGDTSDDLLANDVESSTNVSTSTLTTTYGLLSVSVQSTSEVSTVALTQGQALLTNDVQATSELTAPALAEFDNVDDLLVVSVQSTSELSVPAITTVSILTATSVESNIEITIPRFRKIGNLDVIPSGKSYSYYCGQTGNWHKFYNT